MFATKFFCMVPIILLVPGAVQVVTGSKCTKYSEHLEVQFAPASQEIQLESTAASQQIRAITCAVNKPVKEIAISFKPSGIKLQGRRTLPRGVKVTTTPCGRTVQFNKKYKTECQNGTYVCVVTDESGNKYVKEAQVLLVDAYHDTEPKFRFEVEGSLSKDTAKLGSSINLTCTYRDKSYGMPFSNPFIGFYTMDVAGNLQTIPESVTKPIKTAWSQPVVRKTTNVPVDAFDGTRKLLINDVSYSDGKTYFCVTICTTKGCWFKKALRLEVY